VNFLPVSKDKQSNKHSQMKSTTLVSLNSVACRQLGLAAFLAAATATHAQSTLTSGHADVGVLYENDAWNLHVHAHAPEPDGTEYTPAEAVLQVGAAGRSTVPGSPAYAFLGPAGAPVYILPQVENPALLFLGIGTEEQASGMFVNDAMTLSLTGVSGLGSFFMYEVGAFGTPTVLMNSANGVTAADQASLLAGGHKHVNWAFSAPGDYQVTFRGSGVLADGLNTFSQSAPATYTFSVVPEPGSASLLLLGGTALFGLRRRTRV
jgi:surface-anchored protein